MGLRIGALGELGVIRLIEAMQGPLPPGAIGIGDDAAFWPAPPGALGWLISQDMLVESQHFRWDWATPEEVGWKAAQVNLSDIAAMGGEPFAVLTSLAIPAHGTVEQVRGLYSGLTRALSAHGVPIIGGDTVGGSDRLVLDVTILGKPSPCGPVRRQGARVGDRLVVSGWLGSSYAGYLLLSEGVRTASATPSEQYLLEAHLMPQARLSLGRMVAEHVSAMTDISDGLAREIFAMLLPGQGADIHLDQLPIRPEVRVLAERHGADAAVWAVWGGEDYELLMAVPPEALPVISQEARRLQVPLTEVGAVTGSGEVRWMSRGRAVRIEGDGVKFEHF
ncbi:MAG: thiamine-phosphate kinase [Firmicutes bacterium]|nr:thiamine-phosphate kinase [Bacillota bacterium]